MSEGDKVGIFLETYYFGDQDGEDAIDGVFDDIVRECRAVGMGRNGATFGFYDVVRRDRDGSSWRMAWSRSGNGGYWRELMLRDEQSGIGRVRVVSMRVDLTGGENRVK